MCAEIAGLRGQIAEAEAANKSMLESLAAESSRLDWLLGSYTLRRAIMESGALDAITVQNDGARAAINQASAAARSAAGVK
jgi:hypothetical protein